jgi:hypothetical protein
MELSGPVCKIEIKLKNDGQYDKYSYDELYSERFKHPRCIAV